MWLERLLDQERTEEVKRFLDSVSSDQLFITDFSFHSIGVILSRLDRREGLLRFVQDTLIDGAVRLIGLSPTDIQRQVNVIEQFRLDFDDAYQYVVAEQFNLTLVSFDSDFDQTPRSRKTPAEILAAVSLA